MLSKNHLHTDYEQGLVLLFFKVQWVRCSGSKLDEDAVNRGEVVPGKLFLISQAMLFMQQFCSSVPGKSQRQRGQQQR